MQAEHQKQKRCSKCKEVKKLTEFYKDKSRKDGLNPRCKACCSEYQAKHYRINRDSILEYKSEYYKSNRDAMLARKVEYYKSNSDLVKERVSKYQAANRDKVRVIDHRRRARKRNASGNFTAADWKARLAYHGYRCIYCGVEKHQTPEKYLTMEHLIPLSRGGTNWPSNLAPSCKSCNCSKGTKTHFEFINKLNKQR